MKFLRADTRAALPQLEDSSDKAVFTRIKIQQAVEKLKTIPVMATERLER